jgi:hypothetical protein
LLATITLFPVADNTLYQENPQNSNGTGQYLFSGQAAASAMARRALLKFDVASAIAPGSTINSATLALHVSKINPSAPGPQAYALHRVLAAWGEGTSNAPFEEGSGTTATAGDATWSQRLFGQTNWSAPGGDFVAAASATSQVGGVGSYQWSGNLAQDVGRWLDDPATQFGWLVKEVNESVEGSARRFDSRESPTGNFRPALTIDFTPGARPPTLAEIANPPPVNEDAPEQTLDLTGISAGAGETQPLAVSAQSSNPSLIPTPTIAYISPNAAGSLSYVPVANRSGTATITVTVRDAGADGSLNTVDDGTTTRTFTVTVNAVNDLPTLAVIDNPPAVAQDAPEQTISLAGISAGPLESQSLEVTAQSSNPALLQPAVVYASPAATGVLQYSPALGMSGSATITVTVRDAGLNGILHDSDDGETSVQFLVLVNAADFINQAPSFAAGLHQSVTDEDGPQTVTNWAASISAGQGEQLQTLNFVVETDAPALFLTAPRIDRQGTLTFTPAPNVRGTANVAVRLHDNGGTANGGADTSAPHSFTIDIAKPHVWLNVKKPLDVTGDGNIVSADALAIINFINAFTSKAVPENSAIGPPFYDPIPDNFVAPNDALDVINFINAFGPDNSGGEGEAGALAPRHPSSRDQEFAALEVGDLVDLFAASMLAREGSAKRRLMSR